MYHLQCQICEQERKSYMQNETKKREKKKLARPPCENNVGIQHSGSI